MTSWSGPPVHVGGGVVLIDGESARVLYLLVGHYARSSSAVNGGGTALSAQLRVIDRVLAEAATARGHADVLSEDPAPPLPPDDLIPIREAASMLGVSDRQARRLAEAGVFGAVRDSGHGRLVSAAEVQAEASARRAG